MGSTNLLEQLENVPRDIEQVRNFQKAERRRIALTQDVNYNLQEIADDTKFIQEIVSYPDVAIFMYNKELWDLIKGLLNRTNDLPYMALTVDTTFNMTDAYVTVLIARFTEFDECHVIPLATMVHERKLCKTHRFFWEKVKQFLPELCKANNIFLVSDEEKAIVNALKDLLPDVPAFRCWNHIFTNAKLKLQKLKLTEQKIQSWYVDALEYLFGQETELEYYKALNKFTSNSSLWHKVIFSKTVKYELKRRSLFFNFRNLPSITTGASKRK
jgi:hypothetical protein